MNIESLILMLIGLVLVGAALLVIAYVWYFIIQKSPLRLLMMFVRTAMDRDRVVEDPNAPIQVPTDAHFSDVLKYEAEAAKQQSFAPEAFSAQAADPLSAPAQGAPRQIPKVPVVPQNPGTGGETTSQSGWPVQLDKETSASPRPFLKLDYDTSDKDSAEPPPES